MTAEQTNMPPKKRLPMRRYLTQEQIEALDQYPDPNVIETRPVAGQTTAPYLKKEYVIEKLHEIFGEEFVQIEASDLAMISSGNTKSRATREIVEDGKRVKRSVVVDAYQAVFSCRVQITITLINRTTNEQHQFSVSAYGTDSQVGAESNDGVMPIVDVCERACKGSNTIALKRAAELLGRVFGLELKSAPTKRSTRNAEAQGGSLMSRMKKNMAPAEDNQNVEPNPSVSNAPKTHTQATPQETPQATPQNKPATQTNTQARPTTNQEVDLTSGLTEAEPIQTTQPNTPNSEEKDWRNIFATLQEKFKKDENNITEILDELIKIKKDLPNKNEDTRTTLTKWISVLCSRMSNKLDTDSIHVARMKEENLI